ncbi:MAG: hypothetical protein Q8P60_06565 [Pseudorhodobacter sp.]|nr:hypothetical protein [Pseudorhodobacter sp.]
MHTITTGLVTGFIATAALSAMMTQMRHIVFGAVLGLVYESFAVARLAH